MNSELPVRAAHGTDGGTPTRAIGNALTGIDQYTPAGPERIAITTPRHARAHTHNHSGHNPTRVVSRCPPTAHGGRAAPAVERSAVQCTTGTAAVDHHVDSLGSVSDWTSASETEPVEEPESETEESEEELRWQDACVPELSSRLPRYTGRETPLNFATQ